MANPRKFSEKIALQLQKQAEETAAFEAILKDLPASATVRIPVNLYFKNINYVVNYVEIQIFFLKIITKNFHALKIKYLFLLIYIFVILYTS